MNKKKKKCTSIFRQITDLICFYVLIINFTNVNNFPLLGPSLPIRLAKVTKNFLFLSVYGH